MEEEDTGLRKSVRENKASSLATGLHEYCLLQTKVHSRCMKGLLYPFGQTMMLKAKIYALLSQAQLEVFTDITEHLPTTF